MVICIHIFENIFRRARDHYPYVWYYDNSVTTVGAFQDDYGWGQPITCTTIFAQISKIYPVLQ